MTCCLGNGTDSGQTGRLRHAGVFVTLDRDGSLAVYRGYVRPEDEPREETAVQDGDGANAMGQGGDVGVSSWNPSATSAGGTVITSGGQPIGMDASEDEDDGALKPLSATPTAVPSRRHVSPRSLRLGSVRTASVDL